MAKFDMQNSVYFFYNPKRTSPNYLIWQIQRRQKPYMTWMKSIGLSSRDQWGRGGCADWVTEDPREGCLCGTVTRGPVTSVSSSEAPDLRVWLAGSSGGHGDAVPAFTGTAVLTATITISEIRFDPHNAPCSSAEPKRAQVVVVFVTKVRAIWRVYNTPSHHHPVAVWIVLGYSKLADKLSIYICACESSEGCKCAVIGARECIHHCIDRHDESFDKC